MYETIGDYNYTYTHLFDICSAYFLLGLLIYHTCMSKNLLSCIEVSELIFLSIHHCYNTKIFFVRMKNRFCDKK